MAAETVTTYLSGQFLTFRVKDQAFGLNINHVKEIMAYGNVTPIPLMPEFIKGILNLRGNVLPVLDVSRRFDWEKTDQTKMTCIVVSEMDYDGSKLDVGLMVDAVSEVVRLEKDNLEGSPNFGTRVRADFISNIGKVAGKFVLLLNISRLLDVDEIQQLRDMTVRKRN